MLKKIIACLFCFIFFLASFAVADSVLPLPIDLSGGLKPTAPFDNKTKRYEDPTILVEWQTSTAMGTQYTVAFITIQDASQLRTAPADGTSFVSNTRVPVKTIANRVNAVLAINGDYCAAFAGNRKNNYILRQGELYQDTVEPSLDMLLIDEDGDFHILSRDEKLNEANKTEIAGKKIINAFQFGPAVIIDGEPVSDEELKDPEHSPSMSHPHQREQRMCIGQIGPLQYVVLSTYLSSLPQTRDLLLSLADAKTAYILDGGNSSQMVVLGHLINKSTNKARPITDIVYFASGWSEE